jgi:hypothetical protein
MQENSQPNPFALIGNALILLPQKLKSSKRTLFFIEYETFFNTARICALVCITDNVTIPN